MKEFIYSENICEDYQSIVFRCLIDDVHTLDITIEGAWYDEVGLPYESLRGLAWYYLQTYQDAEWFCDQYGDEHKILPREC